MRALTSSLRKQLESAVLGARRASESASHAALNGLGVFTDRRPEHLDAAQAALRNGLRAKQRQLGGDQELLAAECAYEQWHRLLFARFLAENSLLLHPQYRAPVTLEECEELAGDLGEPDGWSVTARFAAEILPGIFRLDDPCVRLRLAPEGRDALERTVGGLPAEIFAADDALGWVYQFWQKDKKDEINASERKIDGAELGAVTQLFTENYMVRFLLENSLGAWWASRHPSSPLVNGFDYLRFDEDGKPATGSFAGWPERAADVTVMDPCCGSGHFLVEAFSMLWQMRAEEEGLAAVDAQDAVLRDNLFGLELDSRCVQIAMFAVALQAWKAGGGWRFLPVPNIACSGIPVKAPVEEWTRLAGGDERVSNTLALLHGAFRDADTLGSLIDPGAVTAIRKERQAQATLDSVDLEEVAPLLHAAVRADSVDPATGVLGANAAAISLAADLLCRSYDLVATNVPFLGINKHSGVLREALERLYLGAHHDLAYAMTSRCLQMVKQQGTVASVSPSEWLFSPRVTELRSRWLTRLEFHCIARVGYKAFSVGLRVNPILVVLTAREPNNSHSFDFIDVPAQIGGMESVAAALCTVSPVRLSQRAQRGRPDSVVAPSDHRGSALGDLADCRWGLSAGDGNRFERFFWEVGQLDDSWEYLQTSTPMTAEYSGRSSIVFWEKERGQMATLAHSVRHLNNKAQQWRSGKPFWGKHGVAINTMGQLRATLYSGERYSATCMVIVPRDKSFLPGLWHFARSGALEAGIRSLSRSLAVSPGTILKVPVDEAHWRRVADEAGALPEPWSSDPTQWLFNGRPEIAAAPLHVAVARLLGYRWPEQSEFDALDDLADTDGIVCVPAVAGESPAAERLQQVLAKAFGEDWSPTKAQQLLLDVGSKLRTLADWLRHEFFKQHCALFGNRPFVWHIWDGQRDGFSALVNYHRLDRKTLEKLTYTYLGQDWVERQRAGVRDEIAGSDARLTAALDLQRKLEAILTGESPFDIYVRWKAPHEQPIGWEPDFNDGVRLNIRPFVEAGVLRSPFNLHWKKDRGKNPDGSERHNDVHLSLADKLEARKRAAVA